MSSSVSEYDVIVCGTGSGGGFFAGEVASFGSTLMLDAGPYIGGDPSPGFGSPERRRFSTQINLGMFIPDGMYSIGRGEAFFAYPLFPNFSNPDSFIALREARVVGGGSYINVGAWVRPRLVDWDEFADKTGVEGWTKESFEPHFQTAETILTVHRNKREHWNPASVIYEQTARSMGIPVFETSSNRFKCILCGQRVNAGMPCKYDSLMSTTITQVPKALASGAELVDNATVVEVEITDGKATGVVYQRNGEIVRAKARKLVVLSAGAIGTPLILFNSGVHFLNPNVGRHLEAHPGLAINAVMPGDMDWNSERGYQWNCHHFVMDENGDPMDALVYASGAFPTTPWLTAQIGNFGKPYKDLMRRFPQMVGAFVFHLKPSITGRVVGRVETPVVRYFMVDGSGRLDPKILSDLMASVRQVGEVYRRMGAVAVLPSPNVPTNLLVADLTLRTPATGIFHPLGTCRAGRSPETSVVDSNCMSHDVENLMICDASVIPSNISSNSNSMVMAVASRCAEFAITEILGGKLQESKSTRARIRLPER